MKNINWKKSFFIIFIPFLICIGVIIYLFATKESEENSVSKLDVNDKSIAPTPKDETLTLMPKDGTLSHIPKENPKGTRKSIPSVLILTKLLNAENVPYFVTSGTLLGAVRHAGIIPWDTDVDFAIKIEDIDQLYTFLDKYPEYYLYGAPIKPGDKYEPANESSAIKKEDLHKRLHTNIWIFKDGDTVVELEIYKHYNAERAKLFGITAFDQHLDKDELEKGMYVCSIKNFNQERNGLYNVPAIFLENMRLQTFYDTQVPIFRDSIRYINIRFGTKGLTHYPADNRKYTSNTIIKNYSPMTQDDTQINVTDPITEDPITDSI